MPRGKRLTPEEKEIRTLQNKIKKEEKRIYKLAKKNETKLKREETALLRSISRAYAPKRPRGRRPTATGDFIGPLTQRQTTLRANKALREQGLTPPKPVKAAFIGPLTQRQTTLRANKLLREQGLPIPKPVRAPRAPKPAFIGPLTKGQTYYRQRKSRLLQAMANEIPLPLSPRPPAPRRIRVVKKLEVPASYR